MIFKNIRTILTLGLACFISFSVYSEVIPKREFRGVWIHTVGNWKYRTM